MKWVLALILVAIGSLAPVGAARAGHEWTDGTMGPPGRSYDTSMPIFPSAKRNSPPPNEVPSQICDGRVIQTTNPNPATSANRDADRPHQSSLPTAMVANDREICRNPTR